MKVLLPIYGLIFLIPFSTVATHEKSSPDAVASHVRQSVTGESNHLDNSNLESLETPAAALTPELQEFKRELLAALEIPEAVEILQIIFVLLSEPLDSLLVEGANTDGELHQQCSAEDPNAATCKLSSPVHRARELRSEDATEPRVGDEVTSVFTRTAPSREYIKSLLSMEDTTRDTLDTPMDSEAELARGRRLQALNQIRRRAGELVGNFLYGQQPKLTKLFTPSRGPVETVLFGRSPVPRRPIF